jgi:hypothetical protein
VHAYNACAVLCLLYVNPLEKSPTLLHATDISTFTFYFVFFKDALYFLLKYVLSPVLFTLTQVDLLLITSTFTPVQIQSNLGTTDRMQSRIELHSLDPTFQRLQSSVFYGRESNPTGLCNNFFKQVKSGNMTDISWLPLTHKLYILVCWTHAGFLLL